ncbi:hypothetical protein [Oceanobacillus bengalensis]|uniref:Uncharacterized protein n=1 Tax=Oceanobacillus bengalensis TaxID=1435466 RepID=A0A494YTA6_9BACI|nr:hypothetical protein [Oceanobacillus bengalensis]RKQ13353.1 hypothetical protein D8M05_16425 [Oceanobacillus bengalensis]
MTAQIVVMNTGGIALASDSAVTIRGKKVYNSADKLFGFTDDHTIGVMIQYYFLFLYLYLIKTDCWNI